MTDAPDPAAEQQEQEQTADETPPMPIVGIGASAGGLEALEALTRALANDGMAFVILQHLAAGHEATLTDILSRNTAMKVVTIADGMPVEKSTIYVGPTNVDVAIHHGVFRLLEPVEPRVPRHAIDVFFRHLAADRGGAAIGVILSGAGSDGTLGLKAIKEEGGITFVQEPSTASQPSMPESAIDAGCADSVLSPAEIGAELMRIAKHPYVIAAPPPRAFDEDTRSKLFVLLRGSFGVDFATYKQATIERRVQRRMALHKIERLADYLKYVQANDAELSVLYSDLLIGVTSFFRDAEPFEALKTLVLPRLLENRDPELPIRVWVPGCSTGEEAYSIAMVVLEYLADLKTTYKIQVFATDIDDHALTRARTAVYPQSIEIDVSPERLQRFFVPAEKGFQVSRQVRDVVVFARHNLGKDPPFSRLDLVSCRNVLIYMQPVLQRKVLHIFHYALEQNGFLLLGTSESVGESSELFSLVDRKTKIYGRKPGIGAAVFDIALMGTPPVQRPAERVLEHRQPINVLHLADRKVLDKYGPPGVVVNDRLDIVQFRGQTGRYIEPSPGLATLNILKQVRPELLPELRPAVEKALAENVAVTSPPVRVWNGVEAATVVLDVTPLPETEAGRCLLVLFNEHGRELGLVPIPERGPAPSSVESLERELTATKEYLQTTIEEVESGNEELQAANEELQSSNEELQSTNEELETSKEELQSTNEELVTLNEELQNRMGQLAVSTDDLQNVLAHVSAAVVLVDVDLRIRRFSAAAERFLSLVPGDVGRPLGYLRTTIRARDLEQTVSAVINTATPREQPVRDVDGYWHTMRVAPLQSSEHTIKGAVLELVKAPSDKREDEINAIVRTVLSTTPQAFAFLDDRMRVQWCNKAFLAILDVGPEIFGRPLEDLWAGKSEEPTLWRLIEDAATHGKSFKNVASDKVVSGGVPKRFSVIPVLAEDQRKGVVLVIDEVDRSDA
jgi:two-component system CheB/CheR fusion protein